MRRSLRSYGTLRLRFALMIVLTIVVTFALNAIFAAFAGVWARPSLDQTGLLNSANMIVRVLDAAPARIRPAMADAASNAMTQVKWIFSNSPLIPMLDDRTAMLAAISHDLRTPLTKMRLRGEFIEDKAQQAGLFRDVADMQAMINSALSFFRDDAQDEEATMFDFPELLRTIADDYTDQGAEIAYHGPDHVIFHGRPFALKRAFANLIDNAVKYGEAPEVELRCAERTLLVTVMDKGPGIPVELAEQVFTPFYRLERSRNRATGGVGLGLSSARTVIRGHGGNIILFNRPGGGLTVEVTLPVDW